jgi:magnesium transporter
MFLAHPPGRPAVAVSSDREIDGAAWLDLMNPTDEERELAGRLTGLRIPARHEIEEIENSSRVFNEGQTLYLSSPLVRRKDENSFTSPVGFVLGREQLVTLRYTDFAVFETVSKRLTEQDEPHTPPATMLLLMEAMIDRLADLLETVGSDLDALSRRIFHADPPKRNDVDRQLRTLLRRVGKTGDLVSSVRDSLLGLQRIVVYLSDSTKNEGVKGDGTNPMPVNSGVGSRLKTLGKDITSLNDYVAQTNNKVQFLLDATLGFINIEQNNGIRVLTVVSIIGVPPTLVASIYGMNFKNIPELNWNYGYYYALSLMVASVAALLLWFWRKGWIGSR